MNMHSTRSPIKTVCIILILFTLTGTAFAADEFYRSGGFDGSREDCTTDAQTAVTIHGSTLSDHENTTLPACSDDLITTFNAHETLRIKELKEIILSYYRNELEMINHFSIKPEKDSTPAITALHFSSNAAQLTITCSFNHSYVTKPTLTIIENTNPLPVSNNHSAITANSPAGLYTARTTSDNCDNLHGVALYRNNAKLLANALTYTQSTHKQKRCKGCVIV